ncbi:hypothetical protein H0G86_002900 [Trichoderma simmonsii]|uniref:DUF7580 domain-containing protein n=1 Tax=Trichoderma simmonsii TaxID=1491479 RepID=A0A8G0L7J1_9HYPO|nr:hypothetical protein H0G86_002900 [Trichoderma simmonsii]
MSGLEVLGAITGVLGVLPVAVDTLKTYKNIISSIRNAARDLASLIRDLETEQVRLQTTCEVLLEGIAPFSMIDDMTKDPFGATWEKYSHLLRLRLWESEREFKNYTLDMRDAAMELREKLCIYGDGSSRPKDKVSIIRELKKGASFTLNKKDYIDIVSRIKRGNLALSELASKSRGLEPTRQKRSQTRLIRLIRGLSNGIFNAIRNATTCACVAPHRVCLELAPRDAILIPSDVDDVVAQSLKFHVAFGSDNSIGNRDTQKDYSLMKGQLMDRWNNIYFRLGSFECNKTPTLSPSPSTITASTIAVPPTPPKSPRFVSWHRNDKSLGKIDVQTTISPVNAPSQQVTDLCRMFIGKNKLPFLDCFGYIADTPRTFGIYPPTLYLDGCAILTLRELLEGKQSKVARFDYPERLKVAHAIAVNTLHLHSTQWVEESLTLDNVIFFLPNNRDDADIVSLARPFVVRNLLIPYSKQNTSSNTSRPVNLAVFSLGALLVQVMIGRVESSLEMAGVMDVRTVLSKRDAGKRLFDQLLESGGANYKAAVEWCFDSVLHVAGLQNDKCCQQFFQEVVSRLEEDVQLLSEN